MSDLTREEPEALARVMHDTYERARTPGGWLRIADAVLASDWLTAREQAAYERGAAEEREWFKSALTSDVGDLLDVEWLRENWWVKHVVAAHLDGPPALDADPSPSADDEGVAR